MQSSTSSPIASLLCVLAVCTAVQSLGGRVFHATREHKDDKFVTDPSANVPGKALIIAYLDARIYALILILIHS